MDDAWQGQSRHRRAFAHEPSAPLRGGHAPCPDTPASVTKRLPGTGRVPSIGVDKEPASDLKNRPLNAIHAAVRR